MKQHFLVVTGKGQGQINPSTHLAKRIAGLTGTLVTFSTAISAHRQMFPDLPAPDQEVDDGDIAYIPYSDGFDTGFDTTANNLGFLLSQSKLSCEKSLSSVVQALALRGRPVTCVVYTSHLSWAPDVARRYGIPSALYWTQPATVFSIYYHYFHGYDTLISAAEGPLSVVHLPGLTPLQVRDLPSFLTSSVVSSNRLDFVVLHGFRETFKALDYYLDHKPIKVLVNTFSKLEADVLSAVDLQVELIAVGPSLPSSSSFVVSRSLRQDGTGYMEWLDSKPEKSVVYVSFGSISVVKKRQMVEVLKGLRASGKPYLWAVMEECRWEGVELDGEGDGEGEGGMVVEWCSQVRVLRHASVGCFVTHCGWNSVMEIVTHCGWNSVMESMACGVPVVGVPQWTDQGTNAGLAAGTWGMGVRGEVDEDGVVVGEELKRCLDLVMGEGEGGVEIRERARSWEEEVREATSEGGSSDHNLRLFVEDT